MKLFFGNKIVILSISVTLLIVFFHQFTNIFAYRLSLATNNTSDGGSIKVDASEIPPGLYYLSLGRPHGGCVIVQSDRTIASNKSSFAKSKGSLLLGAELTINSPESRKIAINCSGNDLSAFTHLPILAHPLLGKAIQLWRGFTELALGSVMSLGLLLVSFILSSMKLGETYEKTFDNVGITNIKSTSVMSFASISLLYSISLAHYPRLFLAPIDASIIHILLRHLFAFSFVSICLQYISESRRIWVTTISVSAFLSCITGLTAPLFLLKIYPYQAFLFPLSSLYVAWKIFRSDKFGRGLEVLKGISLVWTLSQTLDIYSYFTGINAYSAPTMIAMMAISFALITMVEQNKNLKNFATTSRILKIVKSSLPIDTMLKEITLALHELGHFKRVSAYLDGFCVGAASEEGTCFIRVCEKGYSKATKNDWVIDTRLGRGEKMAQAMENQKVIIDTGSESEWYAVVPIGKHACMNFSDDKAFPTYVAMESIETLDRLRSAASQLQLNIDDALFKTRIAMQSLRGTRNIGVHEIELGSIFFDIVRFSKLTERFGNGFAVFVATEYFPALQKRLGNLSIRESTVGDEMYLVVFEDTIKIEMDAREATFRAVITLLDFVKNDGATMCSNSGYPSIEVRCGANFGLGKLIVTDTEVTTTGNSVNYAKRLMEFARPSEFLVGEEIAVVSDQNYLGERRTVLIKKNQLTAYPLLLVS